MRQGKRLTEAEQVEVLRLQTSSGICAKPTGPGAVGIGRALDAALSTADATRVAGHRESPDPELLISKLAAESPRALTVPKLARQIGLLHFDKREFERTLRDLVTAGRVERVGRTRWRHPARLSAASRPAEAEAGGARGAASRAQTSPGRARASAGRGTRAEAGPPRAGREPRGLAGVLRRTRSGHTFVVLDTKPSGQTGDVRIDTGDEGTAWPGDRVRVALEARRRPGQRARGVVVEILERVHQTVVGVLQASPGGRAGATRWALFPDDERLPPIEIASGGDLPRAAATLPRQISREDSGPPVSAQAQTRGHRRGAVDETRSTPRPAPPARGPVPGEVDETGESSPVAGPVLPGALEIGGLLLDKTAAGRRALARITSWAEARRGVRGRVERLLAGLDDPDTQFELITSEYGIAVALAPEAEREATRVAREPTREDLAGRVDLRERAFVTIDPETARDHDDAVCLEQQGDGGTRVWVAIADVSHYVEEGGALDREAAARATSVYFPDRAVPMLPEALSAHACSLVPDHDRLVLVAEMDYTRDGVRHAQRFYAGVIRSRARLSYEQVAALIAETDVESHAALRERLGAIVPMLRETRVLMQKLLARRLRAGALDLDLPEALLDLSEEGRIVGVRLASRNDAHRMIEELMLEANRAVASFIEGQGLPLPYRIHEEPDPADIETVNSVLAVAGARIETRHDRVRPRDVARALEVLASHRLARILSRRVLRALKQARYSTENQGHFGLAFETYCHFTSPIRRYPDLLVHRQLHSIFAQRAGQAQARAGLLVEEAQRSSTAERRAMEAERAMVDLKKAEFMLKHLYEAEPAAVVGVEKFGLFVELESAPIEGLLPADTLGGTWTLDARSGALVQSGSRRRIRLGDRLVVEATRISLAQRRITFELAGELPREPKAGGRGKSASAGPAHAGRRQIHPDGPGSEGDS